MKFVFQSLLRFLILSIILIIIASLIYKRYQSIPVIKDNKVITQTVEFTAKKIKGVSDSVDFDPQVFIDSATQKLLQAPKFLDQIQDNQNNNETDTSAISEIDLKQLTTDLTDKIKDLPKNQAKEIVNNTCQQILDDIDNAY